MHIDLKFYFRLDEFGINNRLQKREKKVMPLGLGLLLIIIPNNFLEL